MALRKNPKYDIKLNYKRTLEISLIISLFVVIAAFKFSPDFKKVEKHIEKPPEIVKLEDIPVEKPPLPPPPKPLIEIAAPEEIPVDLPIETTELDPNKSVGKTTMKPPVEKTIEIEKSPIFVAVEEEPKPVGGLADIASRLKYPEIAKRVGIQGTVYVQIVVSEKGYVESAVIQKGIEGGCNEEALRVVKETKFSPGKQRGKAVKVRMTIPIKFRLQ